MKGCTLCKLFLYAQTRYTEDVKDRLGGKFQKNTAIASDKKMTELGSLENE